MDALAVDERAVAREAVVDDRPVLLDALELGVEPRHLLVPVEHHVRRRRRRPTETCSTSALEREEALPLVLAVAVDQEGIADALRVEARLSSETVTSPLSLRSSASAAACDPAVGSVVRTLGGRRAEQHDRVAEAQDVAVATARPARRSARRSRRSRCASRRRRASSLLRAARAARGGARPRRPRRARRRCRPAARSSAAVPRCTTCCLPVASWKTTNAPPRRSASIRSWRSASARVSWPASARAMPSLSVRSRRARIVLGEQRRRARSSRLTAARMSPRASARPPATSRAARRRGRPARGRARRAAPSSVR